MTRQEEIEDEEEKEKHRSDWIKAEYETLGWHRELTSLDVAIEPLID